MTNAAQQKPTTQLDLDSNDCLMSWMPTISFVARTGYYTCAIVLADGIHTFETTIQVHWFNEDTNQTEHRFTLSCVNNDVAATLRGLALSIIGTYAPTLSQFNVAVAAVLTK